MDETLLFLLLCLPIVFLGIEYFNDRRDRAARKLQQQRAEDKYLAWRARVAGTTHVPPMGVPPPPKAPPPPPPRDLPSDAP